MHHRFRSRLNVPRSSLGWFALAACAGCSTPTQPQPPGGGERYVLDFQQFSVSVAPVLEARGCSATGDCHGGGIRGTFQLSAPDQPDTRFDFEQAALQVWGSDPQQSPLLRKPLAEASGGLPHAHEAFASTDDPDYQTILTWILAGEFE